MRCPYCGGINTEQAGFCVYCGRDLKAPPPTQPRPPRQAMPQQVPPGAVPAPPRQAPHAPTPGGAAGRAAPRTGPPSPTPTSDPTTSQRSRQRDVTAVRPAYGLPPAPPAPAPFPPTSFAELQALEPGAQAATVLETVIGDGRKKVVRISYPKVVPWQQVATLLQVCNAQREDGLDTIIIQGVTPQDSGVYAYTNGQLCFDRNVRLGSQTVNRYQIETGNGYEGESVRIVLTE